jgi:hypothetical protein
VLMELLTLMVVSSFFSAIGRRVLRVQSLCSGTVKYTFQGPALVVHFDIDKRAEGV